jgi:hypothetical protein
MAKQSSGGISSAVPSAMPPKGSKQTSGKVKHARMTTGAKVENLSNLPKVN